MFLTIINPQGMVTSIALSELAVWRLELFAFGTVKEEPEDKPFLSIAIRYVIAGTTAHAVIAAVDCKAHAGELDAVIKRGLPSADRQSNKEAVREGLKVLTNSLPSNKEMEEVLSGAMPLVDLYHDLLASMYGTNARALASLGARLKGQLGDWRYVLTDQRFQPWMAAGASAAPGIGPPPQPEGSRPPPPPPPPPAEGGETAGEGGDAAGDPPPAESGGKGKGKGKGKNAG